MSVEIPTGVVPALPFLARDGYPNKDEDHRGPTVLDTKISQRGSCVVITQYISGWHPHLGCPHWGWTGQETISNTVIIRPIRTFMVEERTNGHVSLNGHRPWIYLTKILGIV